MYDFEEKEERSQWIKDLDEELAEDLKDLKEEDYAFPKVSEEHLEKTELHAIFENGMRDLGAELAEDLKRLAEDLKRIKLEEVSSAWNDPGPAPGYHRKMQAKLRKEWPVLAAALDRL